MGAAAKTCRTPRMMILFLLILPQYQAKSVQFQPTDPKIVNMADKVDFHCRHNDSGLNVMLWYQQTDTGAMELIGYSYVGSEAVHEKAFESRFKITRKDTQTGGLNIDDASASDSAVYFCAGSKGQGRYEAYFGQGTRLTVLEDGAKVTEPVVKILPPSPNECGDQKKKKGKRRKTLVCVASGFYPDHVRVFWQINGQDITDGVATDAAAKKDESTKTFSITSRLRLQAKTWFNPDNEFSCYVTFFNGSSYTNYPASIKPNETDTGMTREKYLKITQNAKLSYSALIVKSCLYAALVCFLVWRLQSSPRKQKK